MSEWHNLGKHVRREIIGAILKSPALMAMVAAQLEGKGEDIDEATRVELKIDSVRVRLLGNEDKAEEG